MDFTINTYKNLLESLQKQGYSFQSFAQFIERPKEKSIVLRHDVDKLPENSLAFAKIQTEQNLQGTYYFRVIPKSFNEPVIKEIAEMGHEIGYHYEDLTLSKGDIDKAYESFCRNLEKLQKLYPVKTICMHGSPKSKYDSRDIWKKYDYKKLGLIGEPYFDIDFNKVLYLTDTGRCWDGDKFSIRDKVDTSFNLSFHNTNQIIQATNEGKLPDQIMFTIHPQRWSDKPLPWLKEWIMQNIKNRVKQILIKRVNFFY
jgi:hypothetical protein